VRPRGPPSTVLAPRRWVGHRRGRRRACVGGGEPGPRRHGSGGSSGPLPSEPRASLPAGHRRAAGRVGRLLGEGRLVRQLVFNGSRATAWVEAPDAKLTSDTGAVVEPIVVSTCDMDAVALSGVIRFRPGTPLGHEGVGVVVDVGDDVTTVAPGDKVIIPW